MELDNLRGFVILMIVVGMVLGVGVLILSTLNANDSVTRLESVSNESVTWPDHNATVALAQENATSITNILNVTGGTKPVAGYKLLTGGLINASDNETVCRTGDTCYVYYTFRNYNTGTNQVLKGAVDAIKGIATNWLALIITIAVLSIIMVLVIKSFGSMRN